jgi:TRAP-type C4-dicarboxylate transport system permease small subunit
MKKLSIFFLHFEEAVCAILLIVMVSVSSINIISRYLPGISFAATEELVVNLFVWLTMLGGVVAVKHKAHISITFIARKIPVRFQNIFILLQWLAIFIMFSLLLFYGAIETWSEYRAGMMTYSLGWPFWFFTLSLPVGSLLFLIRFSQKTLNELKSLR